MKSWLSYFIYLLIWVIAIFTGNSAYADIICSDTSSTNATGTLYDAGGSSSNYYNSQTCGFLIQPTGGGDITLSFSVFDYEDYYDYLYVYDGTSTSGTLLGSFTRNVIPASVTATSGSMYIVHYSDYIYNYPGFAATWSTASSGSCSATPESVEDNFNSVSYNLNNGSENWSTGWAEEGESDGPSTGLLRVDGSLCSSGNCLRLGVVSGSFAQTFSTRSIYREVDLSNTSSQTLSYTYRIGHAAGSMVVRAWASSDGGSNWSLLKQYSVSSSNFSGVNESINLSSYASANTRIRFDVEGSSAVSGFYIDNIEITYTKECPDNTPDEFLISHDTQAIYCLSEPMTVTAKSSGNVLDGYDGTITLDTQTETGTWSLLSGNGTLIDSSANDGLATYTYDSTDNGVASFNLSYSSGSNAINIDVYDGSVRDDDSEGNITFSASGFSVTASALSNPPVTPIDDPIITQLSGQAFNMAIAAYGTNADNGECGIIETYNGNKNITLTAQYSNPTTGTLNVSGSGSVNFLNGQAVINTQYNDVGEISVSVLDSASSISGQSNSFVVRPTDFSISVDGNPATTNTGSGFSTSGEAFTINVQALNALGNATPNYGNEQTPESVSVTLDSLVFPSGGNVGTLSNGSSFTKVGSNSFQNTSASWDEVGSLRLVASVADGDYLGVGNVSSSASGVIGRFYPSGFSLSSENVANGCSSFTYFSQPNLSVAYTLSAINGSGDTVTNYDEGLGYIVGSIQYHAELDNNGTDLGSRLSTTTTNWAAGEYILLDNDAVFSRGGTSEAPFNGILLGMSVSDVDGAGVANPTMNASANGDCVASANCNAAELGSASFYYGRLSVLDAYGPETAALPVKFSTEYWNGQQFVDNVSDNCTVIPRGVVEFNGAAITTSASLSVDLSGGTTTAQFASLTGSDINAVAGDFGLSFTAPGSAIATKSFTLDVDLTSIGWLRFDWDQNNNDNDDTQIPTKTISFKTYRGHDRVLYWRHKY